MTAAKDTTSSGPHYTVASTRVQSWGTKRRGSGITCRPHWGRGNFFVLWSRNGIFFCEFWGDKFKVIVSSLSGVRIDSVANFAFSSKAMNKRHHYSLNAVIERGRLILVCYVRKYVIILVGIFPLTSHNQNIRGCVPGIPGGVDTSGNLLSKYFNIVFYYFMCVLLQSGVFNVCNVCMCNSRKIPPNKCFGLPEASTSAATYLPL